MRKMHFMYIYDCDSFFSHDAFKKKILILFCIFRIIIESYSKLFLEYIIPKINILCNVSIN